MSEPTVIAPAPTATSITALLRRIEGMSGRALALATAVGALPGLAGAPFAGPLPGTVLILFTLAWVTAGILAIRHRNRVASLPLEISEVALAGTRGATRTYRFRARLGRGRRVRDPRVEVRIGSRVLSTARLPPLIGPFTIYAVDAQGSEPEGTLVVRVSGREGGRRWEAERAFGPANLRPGRFAPGVVHRRGRLELDPERWDAVLPEEAP